MSREVVLRPQARQDLIDLAYFFAETDLDVSDRFLSAVENALQRLAEMPEIGSPKAFGNSALAGLRMWPVPGFQRNLIFYLVHGDSVEIVRVLHASRDQGTILGAEGG